MMKWLVIIIGLILLPLFVVWENNHFHSNLSSELNQQINSALQKKALPEVKYSLNYVDATLTGFVDTVEQRSEAGNIVNDIHGVRVRAKDNQIQVHPKLEISRNNSALQASGWLNPTDTTALDTWVTRSELQKEQLDSNPVVSSLSLDQQSFLSQLLKEFFALPGARSIQVSPKGIILTGDLTLLQLNGWEESSRGWFDPRASLSQIKLYPSIYHFPGYKQQTVADTAGGKQLAKQLLENPIYFATGSAEVSPTEMPKVQTIATTIGQSGEKVEFIVGGHTDSTGSLQTNMALGKQRAESVINWLVNSGIDKQRFTIHSFGPSQLAGNDESEEGRRLNRRVEILIK